MALVSHPRRDEVWLVTLDPTHGSEMQKTRPCVVVSPDEMNEHLRTVIIAPMTTTVRPYPTRVSVSFHGKSGQIALDQIRAVDRQRLIRNMGRVSAKRAQAVTAVLVEMFARE
ncbi:MAG: type II toxin-antitoxin system PemK/MazF family toxin [Planctomycetaceae bacterium]|nr:MAG: type II toxin-antitoxin system PemK/MazF family toxin [Planctomycetaceae bacterium]